MTHLDIDGAQLEYRWIGPGPAEAPTIVMLHEGLGSVGMWRDFPDQLAEATGLGVLVYSRRGYGNSSGVEVPRPLSYMHEEGLDVLPKVLEAAGVERAVLLGHSDGASIALIHAGSGRAPLVEAVIVMAPHVVVEDFAIEAISGTTDAYRVGGLKARLERWHGANVDCAFWGWNMAWLHPDFRKWDIREYLPLISVPTLVIQGHDDEYGTTLQVDLTRDGIAGPVEVLLLDDCGHSPHKDQPAAVIAAVQNFLNKIRA